MEYVMSINPDLMSQQEIIDLVNTFYDRLDTALCQDVSDLHAKGRISDEVFNIYNSNDINKMEVVEEYYQDYLNLKEKFFKNNPYKTSKDFDRETDLDVAHFRDIDPIKDMRRSYKVARELPPILIWGSPGIGKSEIIRAIAKKRGISLIDIRLAQRDAIDIKGIPTANDFKRRTVWYLSGEWPDCPISKGIIFFDELTAADKPVQVSAYEIILERKLGEPERDGYALPNGWYIASAGNLKSDDAKSEPMSSALANRLLHIEIDVDPRNWLNWARSHGVHPSVIQFIEKAGSANDGADPRWLLHNMGIGNTQDKLRAAGETEGKLQANKNVYDVDKERGWPSPRSWDRVSSIVYTYEEYLSLQNEANLKARNARLHSDGYPTCNVLQMGAFSNDVFKKVIVGLIGKFQGQRFYAYYSKFRALLDLVVKILNEANYQKSLEIRDKFFTPNLDDQGLFDKKNPFYEKIKIDDISIPQLPTSRSNPIQKKKTSSSSQTSNEASSIAWREALIQKNASVSGSDFLEFAMCYYSPEVEMDISRAVSNNKDPESNPAWALQLGAFVEVLTIHLFSDSLLGSDSNKKEEQLEDAFTTFWIILQILFAINLSPQAVRGFQTWKACNDKFNLRCAEISKKESPSPFEKALLDSQSIFVTNANITLEKRNFIRINNVDAGGNDKTSFILDEANISTNKSSNISKTGNVSKVANGSIPVDSLLKNESRRSQD